MSGLVWYVSYTLNNGYVSRREGPFHSQDRAEAFAAWERANGAEVRVVGPLGVGDE